VDVIQDVGAYAGFAAVVGLAVLAALYFSQARDVKRLREWAGRAPERSAEQAAVKATTPEQAAQQAARPAAAGAVKPIPAVKPAGAKPETAEKPAAGKPGAAPPVPATAAAAAAGTAGAASGPAPATPAAAPGKDKSDDEKKDGDKQDQKAAPAKAPDGAPPKPAPTGPQPATPSARPPTPPPVVPTRPAPPVRSPAAAASASHSTAVLPASSTRLRDRARRGGSDGLSPRYIALIAAGVIVIGGGVIFGISQLGGDDGGGTAAEQSSDEPQAPINPSTVTVSVLNGTTVPGLAAQIGDEVESAGFQRGNVANALDQQRTTSTVLYAESADREAKLVAKRLGIATVEPIDPDSAALGGNASVVVIVGADQTQ
jgi:hypothetical protein